MLTKEFLGKIANASGLTKKEVEHLLTTTNAIVRENLMVGKSIPLQGVGVLEVKTRKERTFVHPRTGERSTVPGKNQLTFRAVDNLKDELKKI